MIVQPEPLPATNETLHLKTPPMSLNDHVKEALTNGAWDTTVPYLQAVQDKFAVTGSVMFDRSEAAKLMKQYGVERRIPLMAEANLKQLDHSINVALRQIIDEEGKRCDRKSRKLLEIEKMKERESDAPVTDNG